MVEPRGTLGVGRAEGLLFSPVADEDLGNFVRWLGVGRLGHPGKRQWILFTFGYWIGCPANSLAYLIIDHLYRTKASNLATSRSRK